jgi:FMN phosphatase YigB (HAD superfamily)
MDEKGLGKRLQAARQAAGLTQQQLCTKTGLSYSTLAKIERGAIKTPSVFTIQSIAEVLGTGMDQLLGLQPTTKAATPAAPQKHVSRSGVRFVYFDINGCLVRFFHRAFTQIAADYGATLDGVEAAFWHYNDDVCRGNMTMDEFNAALAQRLAIPELDWESYYLDSVEPIPEMEGLVAWAAKNYRVGLLSNIMPGFITAMRARELLPNVDYDAVIDSSEVHHIKPDPEMFDLAAKEAAAKPTEILLVDDGRPNLIAAEHAAWHTLWFDDYHPEESIARIRETLTPAT